MVISKNPLKWLIKSFGQSTKPKPLKIIVKLIVILSWIFKDNVSILIFFNNKKKSWAVFYPRVVDFLRTNGNLLVRQ